jgi:hypothetical protein
LCIIKIFGRKYIFLIFSLKRLLIILETLASDMTSVERL